MVLANTFILSEAEDAMNHVAIRVERAKLGLRQYKVAAALDVPQSVLSSIEHGHKSVSPNEATRIIEVMRGLSRQPSAVPHPTTDHPTSAGSTRGGSDVAV